MRRVAADLGQAGLLFRTDASALTAYSAEPGTPDADNLALLASWAATNVAASPATGTGQAEAEF